MAMQITPEAKRKIQTLPSGGNRISCGASGIYPLPAPCRKHRAEEETGSAATQSRLLCHAEEALSLRSKISAAANPAAGVDKGRISLHILSVRSVASPHRFCP